MSIRQDDAPAQTATDIGVNRQIQWNRILIITGLLLVMAIYMGLYYKQSYIGLTDRSSMDVAQIARNISENKGFSTRFIRPFNLAFLKVDNTFFPELNSAPLYPYALATAFQLHTPSDQVVIWISLIMLFLAAVATYLLGRLLFDWRVGILSACIFGMSAPALKMGTSGQEWTLAAILFTLLLCAVALFHRSAEQENQTACFTYTALSSILLGLLYMTYQVTVFLALPLAVYFAITGVRRKANIAMFLIMLALVISPLVYRNAYYTGSPLLGANTWDIMANTDTFPGDTFYRSTNPTARTLTSALLFPMNYFSAFMEKISKGTTELLASIIQMLGLVMLPFSIVSILYKFKDSSANAVRGILYFTAPLIILTFAAYNVNKNAVIIFAPIAAIFASAYFLLLLEAKKLHPIYTRTLIGVFAALAISPSLVTVIWGTNERIDERAIAADRFYAKAGSAGASGTVYTDTPWTAAWRTTSTAIWLPRTDTDIAALEENAMPMGTVVLTPESANYPIDEAWYALYSISLWREYVENPKAGFRKIVQAAKIKSEQSKEAEELLARLKRSFAIAKSIEGLREQRISPLESNNILVFSFE